MSGVLTSPQVEPQLVTSVSVPAKLVVLNLPSSIYLTWPLIFPLDAFGTEYASLSTVMATALKLEPTPDVTLRVYSQ